MLIPTCASLVRTSGAKSCNAYRKTLDMNWALPRWLTLAFFAFIPGLASCSDASSGTDPEGMADGGDPCAADAGGDAGSIGCWFEKTLEFGWSGQYEEDWYERRTSCLRGNKYHRIKWEGTKTGRFSTFGEWIPTCDPESTVAVVHAAIENDPEVKAALTSRIAVYGLDQRSVANGMYSVRAAGPCFNDPGTGPYGFDLGPACEEGTQDCHPIPPAIARFAELLQQLEKEGRPEPKCSLKVAK